MAEASGDSRAVCYINGRQHVLPGGRAEATLLQYLREVGLTGAKLGCGEGGCGACTVMLSSVEPGGGLYHRSVNACLCPLYTVEGCHVVTVEGIGNCRDGLHPVQQRLAEAHGSQCGFCTPGFVMSMYSLLRSSKEPPTQEEIEENLAGNLCRCTGYRPILDAFRVFAKTDPAAYSEEAIAASRAGKQGGQRGRNGGAICPTTGRPCDCGGDGQEQASSSGAGIADGHADSSAAARSAPSVEPTFPPELRRHVPVDLCLPGPVATWHRPVSLERLLALKAAHPGAKLVVGNSEVGIEMKFKRARYPALIAATHVPELNDVEVVEGGVYVGASVTLSKLDAAFKRLIAQLPAHQTSGLRAAVAQLRWFAGPPIRNAASLGGNVATASPISDLNPLWVAAGAVFELAGQGTGTRRVAARDFFLGYRKTALAPHEVLLRMFLPFTRKHEYVREFKQARRRDDDIAIVNAGMRARLSQSPSGEWVVAEASIAFGGVAPLTVQAPAAAAALVGRPLGQGALQAVLAAVCEDVSIEPNAPGGMVEFRRSLAASFAFKFLVWLARRQAEECSGDCSDEAPPSGGRHPNPGPFPRAYASAAADYERPPSKGLQYFAPAGAGSVACGEALYVDDLSLPPGGLHAALVLSTAPHARILSIDAAPALALPGVRGVYTAQDVPGGNDIGPVIHDEELFATELVTCVGQPLGVAVADTEAAARAAAAAVAVKYEPLPAILDIASAIEADSYYEGAGSTVESGDVDVWFSASASGGDLVLEGDVRIGGQEHFYLEPNASLVIPGEADELTAYSSTQCPDKHQRYVAHVLGLPMHKVVVRTKRLGGGFGGKETRAAFITAAAAVASYRSRAAVRLVLDRDEDMAATGQRHPFYARYKVGFSREGLLRALDLRLYSNAGNSLDLSGSIMDRALVHADNCYAIPSYRARGFVCRTHLPSNTAFRGFGGPQGMLVTEQIMDRVARTLGLPPEAVRAANMYKEGDVTPFGQQLRGCQARTCWEQALRSSDFAARREAVSALNAGSRYRKRGLAALPTKFGISFTTKFLNQAGALVHAYTDGTVLVTHGGVEMGQGLHTKVCQLVAAELGIELEAVHVAETSTDKARFPALLLPSEVPNASPTAASASSDMYGAAAVDACRQLASRLAPLRQRLGPGATFKEVVQAAHLERLDLCAHGFYATPDITGFGGAMPFNYFCYGAAVCEVELDVLTGDWQALRADIVMDVGRSINPAIDVGQVEGGFVQGLGWSCLEELAWGDADHPWVQAGTLFTRGPGTYKIPAANDIPADLRVTLLRDAPCARTPLVASSKAVGEPPFFLGASVAFALKDAVAAARADAGAILGRLLLSAGLGGWFPLDSPATPERLRLAAGDEIAALCAPPGVRPKLSC